MSQIQHFRDFIFEDHLPLINDTWQPKFANEISSMKILQKASWPRKLQKLPPSKICMYAVANVSYCKFANNFLAKTLKQSIFQSFAHQNFVLYGIWKFATVDNNSPQRKNSSQDMCCYGYTQIITVNPEMFTSI